MAEKSYKRSGEHLIYCPAEVEKACIFKAFRHETK